MPKSPGTPPLTAAQKLCLALAVLSAGCPYSTPYRKTWQPITAQDVFPPLVNAAIALEPAEVDTIRRSGGVLIGFQATHRQYSERAASVGGTHFVAVAGAETTRTDCTTTPFLGAALTSCSTSRGFRPTKIAVFRVEVEGWRTLPPHLVPPTSTVANGVEVYVTRDGCRVADAWGSVKCSNDWKIHRWGAKQ